MHRAGFVPGGADFLHSLLKCRKLRARTRFVIERAVKMRINAADSDVLLLAVQAQDSLHVLRQEAEAPHAGVDLDVHLRNVGALRRDLVDQRRHLRRADGQNCAQVDQAIDLLCIFH